MPEWLREWWPLIVLVTPFVSFGLSWAVRMGLASKSDLAAEKEARALAVSAAEERLLTKMGTLGTGIGGVGERVSKLENEFQHLPTKEQVHKLELTTTEMKGDVKAMNETMKGVASTAGRLEGYLLSAERPRNNAA